MMRQLRPATRAAPWPYDLVLIDPAGQRLGLMLVADPFDVESEKQQEQKSVTPTDYAPSSRDPFVEGTRRYRNWVLGAGERLRRAEGEQQAYYVADGVDASCGGVAILGPESTTVTPSGSGSPSASPITLIHEWPGSSVSIPTPRLYALCGQQVLVNSGDPASGADWSVSKDFAITYIPTAPTVTTGLATPAAPTVTQANGTGATTYTYKLVALGGSNPPRSIPSAGASTTNTSPLSVGVNDNSIDWSAVTVAGAVNWQVWRTAGGTVGKIYEGNAVSFVDSDEVTVITAGAPPATGSGGATAYSYKVVALGLDSSLHTAGSAAGSTATGAATLSASLPNRVAFPAVTGASDYQVWRSASAGTPATTGLIGTTGGVLSFTDDGVAVTTSGSPPAATWPTPTDLYSYNYNAHPYLFIGMDYGPCWYTEDGVTWTQHAQPGAYFTHIEGTFYRAAQLSTTPGVTQAPIAIWRTSGDPTSGSGWTSISTVDRNQPITKLLTVHGVILVFNRNAITLMDEAEITPTPTIASADNGRTAAIFGGDAYATFGGEWYRISVTSSVNATVEAVGLGRFVQNLSSVKGAVVASAGHNTWFNYFCVYNGSDTYLCKLGSWLNPGETSTRRWEFADHLHGALTKWTGRRAYSMLVSSISGSGTVGNPRLFVGMDNGTFRPIVLPLYTPFPPADSSCRFLTSGSLELGVDDFGFGANEKSYHRATVLGPSLTSARTASLDYDLDSSGTYTALAGTFTSTGASVTFPEDVETEGHQIQLRLDLASSANTATPQVDEVQLHAQVLGPSDESGNPGFIRERTLTVLCNDGLVNRAGYPITQWSGQQLRDRLQGFVARAACTAIFRDGVRRECSISEYHEGETIGRDGERRQVVRLKMTETALATAANADAARMDPGWGP